MSDDENTLPENEAGKNESHRRPSEPRELFLTPGQAAAGFAAGAMTLTGGILAGRLTVPHDTPPVASYVQPEHVAQETPEQQAQRREIAQAAERDLRQIAGERTDVKNSDWMFGSSLASVAAAGSAGMGIPTAMARARIRRRKEEADGTRPLGKEFNVAIYYNVDPEDVRIKTVIGEDGKTRQVEASYYGLTTIGEDEETARKNLDEAWGILKDEYHRGGDWRELIESTRNAKASQGRS